MNGPIKRKPVRAPSTMGRLRGDVRGNTLAIMAIALIPISAMVGSGIDTARLYVVKVRLQQACDAGVLAGRKAMMAGNTSLDTTATGPAQRFFNNNFASGWMRTSSKTFTPSATSDNQVNGTASVNVPMTIMKMFNAADVTISVKCQARYDVPDADIMFVLDTTGSMACVSPITSCGSYTTYTRPDMTTGYKVPEQSGSKLQGLRDAVTNFYTTLSNTADPSTHIRYGFVTYSSTVNAGYAVRSVDQTYLADRWKYQTRRITGEQNPSNNTSSQVDTSITTSAACTAKNNTRSPGATYSTTDAYGGSYTAYPFNTNGTAIYYTTSWASSKCTVTSRTVTPIWTYGQYPYSVSNFVTGSSVTDPSKVTGASVKWQGCLEERDTTTSSSFSVTNLPPDLDPDLIPNTEGTKWRPMWPEVIYYRDTTANVNSAGGSTNPYGDTASTSQFAQTTPLLLPVNAGNGFVSCGKPVVRLQEMTASDISNYVNAGDFVAFGGTYHDTGMIWGTRMISPNGIFGADTAAWPNRNAPNRYIVFMTDGTMSTNANTYGMYGMEKLDLRVTGSSGTGNELNYRIARFLAECDAAKARNIKVFVVGFGQTLTSELTQCASPGKAYYASDNTGLNQAFQDIAKQVAQLRISQ